MASNATPQTGSHLRAFYTLIFTQVISLIGSRMTGLALSIYLFNDTGNITPLALTALFQFLPQVIGASFAGVFADRYDRRLVMVLADTGQAVGTVLLLISVASGAFQVEHLYVIVFIQSLFGMFQAPAFTSSVTLMVPENHRNRANAIMQLTGPAAGVIAPAFAGGLYAAVGLQGVIAVDLLTFITATLIVLFTHIPRPQESEIGRELKGSIVREALGGFTFLWRMRTLFWVTIHISLVNFLFSGTTILLTAYILGRTGSEATLGLLLGIFNAGAILGGIIMGVWGGTKAHIHSILGGIIISGAFLIFTGMSRTAPAIAISLFLLMLPLPIVNAAAMGLMQAKVPPDIQGRVFAALGQLSTLLIPLSYLVVGPLADTVVEPSVGGAGWETVAPFVGDTAGSGYGLIMVIGGFFLVVTTALVYSIRSVRQLDTLIPDYQAPEKVESAVEGETLATQAL